MKFNQDFCSCFFCLHENSKNETTFTSSPESGNACWCSFRNGEGRRGNFSVGKIPLVQREQPGELVTLRRDVKGLVEGLRHDGHLKGTNLVGVFLSFWVVFCGSRHHQFSQKTLKIDFMDLKHLNKPPRLHLSLFLSFSLSFSVSYLSVPLCLSRSVSRSFSFLVKRANKHVEKYFAVITHLAYASKKKHH